MKSNAKTLSFLLSLVILMTALMPSLVADAQTEQYTITGFNTTRSENALIVYTPDFGETTDTNMWGAEAVIGADNKCTAVSTSGNSAIPEGGFVVSGHGDSATLVKKIKIGNYVYYHEKSMTLTVSDSPVAISREYTVSRKIDGTNVFRDEDMLVIYNNLGKRTGTNDWGIEAIVENGIVTSVGGNDNVVPKTSGSFIISGHGESYQWMVANVIEGMTAEIKDGYIVFGYNANAAVNSLKNSLADLQQSYADAIEQCLLIDRENAKAAVEKAKSAVDTAISNNKSGSDAFWSSYDSAEQLITDAAPLLIESQSVEYRGVWLRPVQTTAKEVDDYVQKLYDTGINLICVETLYNNCMIMPMPSDSLFEQNPAWKGFDMLQAFIDSCHKRGMELHIWLPVYYVGHEDSENEKLSVGYKKPEWLSITDQGKTMGATNPNKFYMLDPSNPEVKEFLLETYEWILKKYDIDGFELDYIRYWERGSEDYGYNEALVNAFKEKYGVTPEYNVYAKYWDDWCDFRAEFVTDMVHSIRTLIDETRPSTVLSLDVGGYPDVAKEYLYQDYLSWLNEGMVDLLHPMCYGEYYDDVFIDLAKRCGTRTMLSVGLGAFDDDISSECIKRQAILVNNVGGNGSCYFEATTYFSRMLPKMLAGLYSQKALTPTADGAVEAKIDEISKRLELMKSDGRISSDVADSMITAARSLNKDDVTDSEITALVKLLDKVKKSDAKDMLAYDINAFARILAVSDKMEWSPENITPEPPIGDVSGDDSSDDDSSYENSSDDNSSDDDPSDDGSSSDNSNGDDSYSTPGPADSGDVSSGENTSGTSSDGGSHDESNNGGVSTALIAVIIVIAVLAVSAVVIIIIKRKNK